MDDTVSSPHICFICEESLANDMVVLPCGHILHGKCLQNWISQCIQLQRPVSCYICRNPFIQPDVVPVRVSIFQSISHLLSDTKVLAPTIKAVRKLFHNFYAFRTTSGDRRALLLYKHGLATTRNFPSFPNVGRVPSSLLPRYFLYLSYLKQTLFRRHLQSVVTALQPLRDKLRGAQKDQERLTQDIASLLRQQEASIDSKHAAEQQHAASLARITSQEQFLRRVHVWQCYLEAVETAARCIASIQAACRGQLHVPASILGEDPSSNTSSSGTLGKPVSGMSRFPVGLEGLYRAVSQVKPSYSVSLASVNGSSGVVTRKKEQFVDGDDCGRRGAGENHAEYDQDWAEVTYGALGTEGVQRKRRKKEEEEHADLKIAMSVQSGQRLGLDPSTPLTAVGAMQTAPSSPSGRSRSRARNKASRGPTASTTDAHGLFGASKGHGSGSSSSTSSGGSGGSSGAAAGARGGVLVSLDPWSPWEEVDVAADGVAGVGMDVDVGEDAGGVSASGTGQDVGFAGHIEGSSVANPHTTKSRKKKRSSHDVDASGSAVNLMRVDVDYEAYRPLLNCYQQPSIPRSMSPFGVTRGYATGLDERRSALLRKLDATNAFQKAYTRYLQTHPDPSLEDPAAPIVGVDDGAHALSQGQALRGGTGALLDARGRVTAAFPLIKPGVWADQWGRPESFIRDLHAQKKQLCSRGDSMAFVRSLSSHALLQSSAQLLGAGGEVNLWGEGYSDVNLQVCGQRPPWSQVRGDRGFSMGGCGFDTPDWAFVLALYDPAADTSDHMLTRTHYHFTRGAAHVHTNDDSVDVPSSRRFAGVRERFAAELSGYEAYCTSEGLHWLRCSHAPMREYAAEIVRGLSAPLEAAASNIALQMATVSARDAWEAEDTVLDLETLRRVALDNEILLRLAHSHTYLAHTLASLGVGVLGRLNPYPRVPLLWLVRCLQEVCFECLDVCVTEITAHLLWREVAAKATATTASLLQRMHASMPATMAPMEVLASAGIKRHAPPSRIQHLFDAVVAHIVARPSSASTPSFGELASFVPLTPGLLRDYAALQEHLPVPPPPDAVLRSNPNGAYARAAEVIDPDAEAPSAAAPAAAKGRRGAQGSAVATKQYMIQLHGEGHRTHTQEALEQVALQAHRVVRAPSTITLCRNPSVWIPLLVLNPAPLSFPATVLEFEKAANCSFMTLQAFTNTVIAQLVNDYLHAANESLELLCDELDGQHGEDEDVALAAEVLHLEAEVKEATARAKEMKSRVERATSEEIVLKIEKETVHKRLTVLEKQVARATTVPQSSSSSTSASLVSTAKSHDATKLTPSAGVPPGAALSTAGALRVRTVADMVQKSARSAVLTASLEGELLAHMRARGWLDEEEKAEESCDGDDTVVHSVDMVTKQASSGPACAFDSAAVKLISTVPDTDSSAASSAVASVVPAKGADMAQTLSSSSSAPLPAPFLPLSCSPDAPTSPCSACSPVPITSARPRPHARTSQSSISVSSTSLSQDLSVASPPPLLPHTPARIDASTMSDAATTHAELAAAVVDISACEHFSRTPVSGGVDNAFAVGVAGRDIDRSLRGRVQEGMARSSSSAAATSCSRNDSSTNSSSSGTSGGTSSNGNLGVNSMRVTPAADVIVLDDTPVRPNKRERLTATTALSVSAAPTGGGAAAASKGPGAVNRSVLDAFFVPKLKSKTRPSRVHDPFAALDEAASRVNAVRPRAIARAPPTRVEACEDDVVELD